MKIKYEFVDGEKNEIEVEDAIGLFILRSRCEEDSAGRKERRHTLSLDSFLYEGKDFGKNDDYPSDNESDQSFNTRFLRVLGKLTAVQRRRLILLLKGMSIRKIAELEEVNEKSVHESVEAIRKKFKKYF